MLSTHEQVVRDSIPTQGGARGRTTLNRAGASAEHRSGDAPIRRVFEAEQQSARAASTVARVPHQHRRDVPTNTRIAPTKPQAREQAQARARQKSHPASPQSSKTVLIRGEDVFSSEQLRRGKIVLCICAILLCIALGTTLSYFSAQDAKTHITPLERIELSLTEEGNPHAGENYSAGLTALKSPRITAEAGDMYARIYMKIEENVPDHNGDIQTLLVTDPARLSLIEGIFFADTQNRLMQGTPYSKHDIDTTPGVTPLYDSAHFLLSSKGQPGEYYFEYIGVIGVGESAYLFNKLVIPSDYTPAELGLMGNFIVTFEGQGIQSFGFSSQADAMAELDKVVG